MTAPSFGLPLPLWLPLLAIGFFMIMVVLVPRNHIRELFIAGLLWGTVASWLFVLIAADTMRLFRYQHSAPFDFYGGPVWLHLSWASVIVIFLHHRPPMRRKSLLWSYILSFSLLSAMLNEMLKNLGLLEYIHWSPWLRAAVAVPWFWGAAWFHARYLENTQVVADHRR